MLYAVEVPKFGGDTEFSNQCMAFDHLSDGMQEFLSKQKIINTLGRKSSSFKIRCNEALLRSKKVDEFRAIHPVVRTHPETKEKALFINEAHSLQFSHGLREGTPLLEFLFRHQIKSEFTCRFKWRKGLLRSGTIDVLFIIL